MRKHLYLLLILLLPACASMPEFDTSKVNRQLTPDSVRQSPAGARGQTIFWSGLILSSKNLKATTRLEVLSYPADNDGWPNLDAKPSGRFLVDYAGYLETANYAQGRLLTVVGPITGTEKGKLDETEYTYPVVQAEQKYLWPKSKRRSDTRVHLGIGVIFR